MANESTKVIAYVADISDVLQKLQQIALATKQTAKGINGDFTASAKTIGDGFASISQSTRTVFDKQTGAFKELDSTTSKFNQQIKLADGTVGTFTQTLKTNADGSKSVSNSFREADKSTVSFGQNIERLAKRAILTIPIWFALRTAISGTFKVISDGIQVLVDQDRVLQKARRTLQGTTDQISKNYDELQKRTEELSIQTGESIVDIANSFYKFSTVGFQFEEAWKGAEAAVKGAILLFGNATETANAFARSMRVLVDRSNETASASDQIQEAVALTAELWKTNAFELNEFTNDLEKFAGTAKTTNITTKETIALLATLSTAGLRNRGGQLLRTSIQKLLNNLDVLARTLGIKVNPQLDSTFDVLLKVIDGLDKLQTTTGTLGPTTALIGKIFGGVRGAEVTRALIALREELKKNISLTGDINKFNQEFEDTNQITSNLVKQFYNLNKEIGKALVVGLVGGDDFNESLKKINKTQKILQQNAENFAIGFKKGLEIAFNPGGGLYKFISGLEETVKTKIKEANDNIIKSGQETVSDYTKILQGLKGKLGKVELQNLLIKILNNKIELDDIAKRDFILGLTLRLNELVQQETIKVTPKLELSLDEEATINELIIKDLEERLKLLGALNSEQLKTEIALKKQFDLYTDAKDVLEDQLSLERSLSEEKRLQSRLGSDSIKLFEIAQTEGIKVAQQIGDVLAGNIDFSSFVRRGGKSLEIFKDQFADIFKQQQALAFFQGNRVPGLAGLQGGTRIPILEEATRGISPIVARTPIDRARAESEFIKAKLALQGGTTQTFNQNNTINQTINVNSPIKNQEDFNEMVKKSYDDPNVKRSLANLQSGNKQTNII